MKLESLKKFRDKLCKSYISDVKQVDTLKHLLDTFPEPQDLMERSFFQYSIQKRLLEKPLVTLAENIAAFFWYYPCLYSFKRQQVLPRMQNKNIAFFSSSLGLSILPDSLKARYTIQYEPDFSSVCLKKDDLLFIRKLKKKYGKYPFFLIKNLYKIALYRAIIEAYHPAAIIATSEYSFTDSILTEFCRENGIRHINIMHGERCLDPRTTFFAFDACYVWDNYYRDLFLQMRAQEDQFQVEVPPSLRLDCSSFIETVDYKFFLQIEDENRLRILKSVTDKLQKHGYSVKLRAHPLQNNRKLMERFFPTNMIEAPQSKSIEQSIGESKTLIARDSTVLLQGYLAGKQVAIDNLSDPAYYQTLVIRSYIMINKQAPLLSDILAV